MSAENETTQPQQSEPAPERVGDILRKERITRRIALETIAKDLKLNVKYIRALESNEHTDLPADPYIRVYLRSLAKYLLLDPEEILKKFYDERGIHDEKFRKGSDTQIVITMADHDKKKETKPWVVILIVIGSLAAISFLAQKIGGKSSLMSNDKPAAVAADTQKTQAMMFATTNPDSSREDSLLGKLIPHADNVADTVRPAPADTAAMVIDVRVQGRKDSVWIQVFSDGVSWKNWLLPNQLKKVTARDSFNVHVGNNSMLEYTLNGAALRIPGRDVVIFKLDRQTKKPEFWTIAKWNSVFKNRL
jgi:cytoskeletal protein RodZ